MLLHTLFEEFFDKKYKIGVHSEVFFNHQNILQLKYLKTISNNLSLKYINFSVRKVF